jgi:hypothetical protein
LLWLTLRSPGEAAGALISLNLSRGVLWQALALVTVAGVLVIALASAVLPEAAPATEDGQVLALTPLAAATILGSFLVILVFALHFTGLAFGGTGTFPAALVVVVWIEVLATAIRIVQTGLYLVAPVLGALASLAGAGIIVWTLVSFVNVLHGFRSLAKAALVACAAVIGMGMGLALILTIISTGLGGGIGDV